MARRQRHFLNLSGIPGADDNAARCRIAFDQVEGVLDLVEFLAVKIAP